MFLRIQNPGVAPVEGYTLLGVSTTRDCGTAGTIGQFGSGAKHAINVLLRSGHEVIVFCGKTRLTFSTENQTIDDGLISKTVQRVVVTVGGRRLPTSWVLDFGSRDWTQTAMALREFVANALDRTNREEGNFLDAKNAGRLSVELVDNVRAKDGYTRVYVSLSSDVRRFYGELGVRFLHFSDFPEDVNKTMLRKIEPGKARIYKQGVLVRESEAPHPSLFDYNLDNLTLDECRNSSEYDIRSSVGHLYRDADQAALEMVFQSLVDGKETFEAHLDGYDLGPAYSGVTSQQRETWAAAWDAVCPQGVVCESPMISEMVERKGFKAQLIPFAWGRTIPKYGIKSACDVLTADEKQGKTILPPTESVVTATARVWAWLGAFGHTAGKTQPEVSCFTAEVDSEKITYGYCVGNRIYINQGIADTSSKMLLGTILEELVHYVTQSGDSSRDFQEFLLGLVVDMAV